MPHPAPRPSILTLWHLLSLDAPTIAVLWTCFSARLTHTQLPLATPIAMALAVWTLYAADRLLDTRNVSSPDALPGLESRHLFHHKHRAAFLAGITVSTLILAALLPLLAPIAIHLYLTEGALVTGYFLLIHASLGIPVPKELIVGPFFAAATFIPTISRNPALRPMLLPSAVLFAVLCSLNCLYIYAWEHQAAIPRAHWAVNATLRHLPLLSVLFLAASALLAGLTPIPAYAIACGLSALVLLALDRSRHRFSRLGLRTAADAALLTPLLLWPFIS